MLRELYFGLKARKKIFSEMMFINFKFLPNIDAIWVLTKLARWTTISDRKPFLDFLVKSTNCDVTLADCHQNVEIFFFHFLSQTYIIWKSIRRRAKHRKPLFDTTRMSRVVGIQKYFSAPPGSIVFLKKKNDWSGIFCYSFIQYIPQSFHCGLKSYEFYFHFLT